MLNEREREWGEGEVLREKALLSLLFSLSLIQHTLMRCVHTHTHTHTHTHIHTHTHTHKIIKIMAFKN